MPPNTTVLTKATEAAEDTLADLEGRETVVVNVGDNDSLTKILVRSGADNWQARAMVEAARNIFPETALAPGQEVRITLKDEVLGGTEVRITEHEGAVQITFVAGTKDAEQLLETQREEISQALGERLGRDVRVTVTDREGADAQ